MNKKMLIHSITGLIIFPAFADITPQNTTPSCDEPTIGVYSGTTNLEAQYEANTINLDWYSDGTKVTSTTCSYSDTITLPSDPNPKTGYTFGGWKLRAAAVQKECTEIEDETECNATSNCGYLAFIDYCMTIEGTRCHTLKNQQECEPQGSGPMFGLQWGASGSYGYCYWDNNKCAYAFMAGGSSD